MNTVTVSEEQVRWFRATRLGLATDGFETPIAAAHALLGAQGQVESSAMLSLSLRTASHPNADALTHALTTDRSLVRCWGQRDTLHVYDAQDWPLIIAAQAAWKQTGRRFPSPDSSVIEAGLQVMLDAAAPVTREDLFHVVPEAYVRSWMDFLGAEHKTAQRYATGRIFWNLTRRGDACAAGKTGSQQQYVARKVWLPDLPWDLPDVDSANLSCVRRYLAISAPASPQDVAYHLGASVKDAKRWLALLETELVAVDSEGRKGLVALAADADALTAEPSAWPTRLLPSYDMKWMSHKDKSWVTPVLADEKRVWRKAAVVAACVVHRGQPVATWTMKKRAKAVDITVEPLSKWSAELQQAIEPDAMRIAAHLGRPSANVLIASA